MVNIDSRFGTSLCGFNKMFSNLIYLGQSFYASRSVKINFHEDDPYNKGFLKPESL